MNLIAQLFALTLVLSPVAFASNTVTLNGQIQSDSRAALAGAIVTIGDYHAQTDQHGEFSITIPRQQIYALDISADNYYGMRYSYSHFELTSANEASEITLAPHQLVAKKANRTLLAFGGDVMMGRRYLKPYFNNPELIKHDSIEQDTKALVQYVAPYLQKADFAAVNLESQIAAKKPAQRAPKSVTFYSPPETVAALKHAGIDYVTLGNNHTYDYLDSGLASTIDALTDYKMPYSGAGKNHADATAPYRTLINQQAFAMLGFVGWEGSSEPNQTAALNKGGAAYGSEQNMVTSVTQQVNANHIPIVQYHGSLEYEAEPSLMTETRLKAALDTGAALAIAHHPHVTQGLELYKGKLIAYSLGNFIFDQYFYATNHSMMLFVWLDKNQFYRAEIVPVYLQGYVPTPATGVHREQVLARLSDLSAKRSTYIERVAGHGVISANLPHQTTQLILNPRSQQVLPLPFGYASKQLVEITHNENVRYRLGYNLANGSDFETHSAFYSAERGFNLDNGDFALTQEAAASGNFALKGQPKEGKQILAMTNFTRVYTPASPATVTANVKGMGKVKIYWQGRGEKQKLFEALEQSEKHLIGEAQLTGQGWQTLLLDFNTPRVGYRSMRILLEFESEQPVLVDDVAFVEWRTPFLQPNERANAYGSAYQANYIGFENAISGKVALTFVSPKGSRTK
jgi:poly-gamma-glutamate capsule biosynthesis protein CapA/YwtB (metallophosphatase superfamily)